ncbi:MAG TPA: response regulator transcription factor [Herpetosiphonaceae bacterium]
MSAPIRILVADDHPVVRDGLVAVLSTQPDFEVVGEAANGLEALERAAALGPDVLLLDLEMAPLDGVETLQRLRAAGNQARVLVFTAFDTDERILGAVRAGAQGYLLKGTQRDELFNAVRVLHAGGSLLQPIVASRLLQQVRDETPPPPALTERERQVLELLARGQQNKEIAAQLGISERTAKYHVRSLMEKLGAGNRTETVSVAVQHGLVKL